MDDDDRRVFGAAAGRVVDLVTAAAAELDAGLTPPQLRVVAVLHEQGPSSVSTVAAATRSAVSSASRTADRLAALGLLERTAAPDDRREVLLQLSRRGRATAEDWARRRSDALADALQDWPADRRAALAALLRTDPLVQARAGGQRSGRPSRPDRQPDPEPALPPAPAAVRAALLEAVHAAPAERAVEALSAATAAVLGARAVQLVLLSRSGADLLPMPPAGPAGGAAAGHRDAGTAGPGAPAGAGTGALLTGPVPVTRAGRAGEALRRSTALQERGPGLRTVHAPVLGRREVVGVLTAVLLDAGSGEPSGEPSEGLPRDAGQDAVVEAVLAAAAAVALLLPAASAGDRRLEQRRRDHEWTVSAEVQDRQLGRSRLVAPGVVAAAQLQPAWSVCTDAHDLDVVATGDDEGAVDAVLLDCRTGRRTAPLAAAVALGALRHARGLGRDLAESAALADQAVFDAFGGEAAVDMVLVRVAADGGSAVALATEAFTVHRLRDGDVEELPLGAHEAAGGTGGAHYVQRPLHVRAGDRLVLVGDGADPRAGGVDGAGPSLERLLRESAGAAPHEVVRLVVLDRTGSDPDPQEDATAVCLDLRPRGRQTSSPR